MRNNTNQNNVEEELLVSICCLTYNHGQYIRECLNGFLMQKVNFDFEILIHDDASTDNTADIIREYETRYPDIIKPIYQTENQYSKGVKPSLKFNFPRARGKYIAMCEGDDYWTDPFKIQKQVDILENDKSLSSCFHDAEVIFDNGTVPFSKNYKNFIKERYDLADALKSIWLIPTASLVFRSSIKIPEIVEELKVGDFALICSILSQGKAQFINEIMCCYIKNNPTSFTNSKFILDNIDIKSDHIKFLVWFNRYTNYKNSNEIESRIFSDLDEIKNYKASFMLSKGYRYFYKVRSLLARSIKKSIRKK